MKKLYLMRHSKSAWENEAVTDFERPLNERGRKDAPVMAKWIKQNEFEFDYIVSSPATRTLITCRIVLEYLEIPFSQINIDERLYEGNVEDVVGLIQEFPNDLESAILFGHNPTIHNLAIFLAKFKYEHVKTSSFIEIVLDIENWADVLSGCGVVSHFVYPKVLQNDDNFSHL